MRIYGLRLISSILVYIAALVTWTGANAQEGMDDFFEDQQYDDEMAAPMPYEPPFDEGDQMQYDSPDPASRPPRPGAGIPNMQFPNQKIQNSTRFSENSDGEIIFKLVDPPKYWVPRKRPYRPPSDFR